MGSLAVSVSPAAPWLAPYSAAKERLAFVLAVVVYYLAFIWSYDALLEPWQGFWGFGRVDLAVEYWVANWMMVLLPALWMPLALRRSSQLLFMCQYLLLFVPATVVLYNAAMPALPPDEALRCLLVLFTGLTIMQSIYLLPVVRLPRPRVRPDVFWLAFGAFTVALFLVVAIFLGANLQFTALKALTSVRFEAAERLESQGALGVLYATGWLASVSLPILFALAVRLRSIVLGAVVVAGYGFLFGVTGTKTSMLAVGILGAAAIVSTSRGARPAPLLALGISALLVFPAAFDAFGELGHEIQRWYVLFVHARIFGVPQLIIAQYLDFFSQHPETLWSQVTGIGAFIVDPYDMDLPRTIGNFFYGFPVGLNGGLWVQDGIAAAGLPGVIVASLVAAGVLYAFDAMTLRVPARFMFVAVAVIAISFTNVPLPTTLVSGGMALMALILYFAPELPGRRAGATRQLSQATTHSSQ